MSSAVGSIREEVSFTKQSFKKLCENGRLCEALQDVDRMDQQGVRIPTSFFYHLLQGCVIKKDLAVGREVHRLIRQSGLQSTSFLGNHLIRMYDSCGSFSEANQAFSDLTEPDVFVWTSLLSVNAKLGQFEQVFKWYQQMHHSNIKPDGHAFVAVLKVCVSQAAFREGQLIHAHIKESDFESNVFVGSTLIDMYAKCGSLEDAYGVFDAMPNRNVITWSTIIMGYAQHGLFWEALQLYKQMQVEGMMPDQVTCMGIIKACASLGTFAHGKLIHLQIVESNFWSDVCVINILIDMYAKCGDLKHSCKVFEQSPTRDVVTWSAMIAGYIQHGHDQEALQLFERMQFLGVQVDRVTLLSSLKACSSVASLYQGNLIHALVIESGLEFDVSIGNTLIDVYVNCESLEDACRVFDRMSKRDTVTWTVMIAGYSQLGQGSDAILLFNQVRQGGVRPDRVIFVSILKTCSSIAALRDGKLIHVESIENGFEADIGLSNTLIDMYSNCRSLEDACRVFSRMPKRDVVTWNAMIAGCFECSSHKLAWQYYEGMQQEGLKPDGVTFVNLLSACSHRGLMSKGYDLLKSMKEDHGIEPTVDHCNCMADLLGRIGRVNEAEDALKTVKLGFNIVGWTSLLSHCKTHGNVEVGERCFEHVVTLDPKNSKGYTLMSNIYVNAGRLEDAEMIEQLRHCANAWKKPGNALVEVDNNVHEFFVGDDAHPQIHDVGKKLKNLSVQMQQKGYMPCLDLTLSFLLDDDRQGALKWAE